MGMDLDEKAHKAAQKRGFSWDINKPDPDYDYTSVESIFEMIIPGNNEKARLGMRGRQI